MEAAKKKVELIFDKKVKSKKKLNTRREVQQSQIKKILRKNKASKNMTGGLSDDEKMEILNDKNNENDAALRSGRAHSERATGIGD